MKKILFYSSLGLLSVGSISTAAIITTVKSNTKKEIKKIESLPSKVDGKLSLNFQEDKLIIILHGERSDIRQMLIKNRSYSDEIFKKSYSYLKENNHLNNLSFFTLVITNDQNFSLKKTNTTKPTYMLFSKINSSIFNYKDFYTWSNSWQEESYNFDREYWANNDPNISRVQWWIDHCRNEVEYQVNWEFIEKAREKVVDIDNKWLNKFTGFNGKYEGIKATIKIKSDVVFDAASYGFNAELKFEDINSKDVATKSIKLKRPFGDGEWYLRSIVRHAFTTTGSQFDLHTNTSKVVDDSKLKLGDILHINQLFDDINIIINFEHYNPDSTFELGTRYLVLKDLDKINKTMKLLVVNKKTDGRNYINLTINYS